MCESNEITFLISMLYWGICFFIPLGYLFLFARMKAKKKNYKRAIAIAIIMFVLLYSVKLIVQINVGFMQCSNCFINNKCIQKEKDKVNDENEIFDEISSSTSYLNTNDNTTKEYPVSSTDQATSGNTANKTTSKSTNNHIKYEKVRENSGNKVDKGKTKKGYSIYEIDGVAYVDGYLIANKTYSLPESYVPSNTYTKADGNATKQCSTCIEKTAYDAWKNMKADAQAIGLNIYISSGFRSYITQSNIYNRNVAKNGKASADTYSARPGSSEHQTGLCFDLNTIDSSFANTAEGKWVAQNAHKYGYIIRYPKGKTDETGYIYEPWHLRYVGEELASKLYNNGNWISMEEYFGITSVYPD